MDLHPLIKHINPLDLNRFKPIDNGYESIGFK